MAHISQSSVAAAHVPRPIRATPDGVAATLGAIQPLVAAALAGWLLRERLNARVVFAGLLGVTGVALLVLRAGARLDTVGTIAGLAGAVSMASGVVLTKYWGRPVPLLAVTSWQLIAGGSFGATRCSAR